MKEVQSTNTPSIRSKIILSTLFGIAVTASTYANTAHEVGQAITGYSQTMLQHPAALARVNSEPEDYQAARGFGFGIKLMKCQLERQRNCSPQEISETSSPTELEMQSINRFASQFVRELSKDLNIDLVTQVKTTRKKVLSTATMPSLDDGLVGSNVPQALFARAAIPPGSLAFLIECLKKRGLLYTLQQLGLRTPYEIAWDFGISSSALATGLAVVAGAVLGTAAGYTFYAVKDGDSLSDYFHYYADGAVGAGEYIGENVSAAVEGLKDYWFDITNAF